MSGGGNHLKVELRRLKRGLDGGYGFDLTRFCAGCWTRLGRILRRGLCCDGCGKRVCKSCRHFLDEQKWICVLCYKKKFSREEWWHDDANVQRFKGSQGKTGTYLLRLTDWSSHGVLDTQAVKIDHTLDRRIRSFSDPPHRTTPIELQHNGWQNLKSKSIYITSPAGELDAQLSSRLGRKWKLKWKLLAHEAKSTPADEPQGNLQYTSSTLKRKRREIRESSRMSSRTIKEQDELRSRRAPPTRADDCKNNNPPSTKDPCVRDLDYYNFLPEAAFLERNDFHTRLSVRGTRVFGRKKSSRAWHNHLEGHMREGVVPVLRCRSASLPSELQQPESHDYDFWNTGFVQSRVRKLEEDLATKCDDRHIWNCDYDVQSLCSLELGRIVPDGDDYRIAYLSSAGTSVESSLDYIDDNISAFGMGTLDVRLDKQFDTSTLDKKNLVPRNEDWDLSFSSTDNRVSPSSEEEDEFDFFFPDEPQKYPTSNIQVDESSNDSVVGVTHEETNSDASTNDTGSCGDEGNEINNFMAFNKEVYDQKLRNLHSKAKVPEELKVDSSTNPESNVAKHTRTKNDFTKPDILTELQNSSNGTDESESKSSERNGSPVAKSYRRSGYSIGNKPRCFNDERRCKKNETSKDARGTMVELFVYEPLSTNFAEIYAISCGKYLPHESSIQENDEADSSVEDIPSKLAKDSDKILVVENSNNLSLVPSKKFDSSNLKQIKENGKFSCYPVAKVTMECLKDTDGKHGSDVNQLIENIKPILNTSGLISSLLEINKIDVDYTLKSQTNSSPLLGISLKHIPIICNVDLSKNSFALELHFRHDSINAIDCLSSSDEMHSFPNQIHQNHLPIVVSISKKSKLPFSQNKKSNLRCNERFDVSEQRHKSVIKCFYPTRNIGLVCRQEIFPSIILKEIRDILSEDNTAVFSSASFAKIIVSYNFLEIILKLKSLFENEHPKFNSRAQNEKRLLVHDAYLLPRNQNYAFDLSETELMNQVTSAGEISESGLTDSRHSCFATSRTSPAAFAEYLESQRQNVAVYERERARLDSTSRLRRITVPAVPRPTERKTHSASQWAAVPCPTTADGADPSRNVPDGYSLLILDYLGIDCLDYEHVDYAFGSSPKAHALLILGIGDSGSACCGTILQRLSMATADEDPRSLGKVVRTQGKNISKLMRFFDSGDRCGEVPKQPAKSVDLKTKQCVDSSGENLRPKEVLVAMCEANSASVDSNNDSFLESSPPLDTSLYPENKVSNGIDSACVPEAENSHIPYCRKVGKSGLWDNVDICGKSNGLWGSAENPDETTELSNSFEVPTAQLHDLIASSRAELSKKAPSISDKSNLENYFTSFENSPPRKCDSFDLSDFSPVPKVSHQLQDNDVFNPPTMYDCDMNEMSFDDEETMLSDSSSEEDLRCHPAMVNTNYLPAYALHTIIEESCEESERDSRTATPTNTTASNLERYFSWDIINDTEADLRKKQDDESTIYSDSLSENSGSLVGDDPKDIDPTQLASSRLEKYFTSGLVDDQNYFYPDDAEFLDDTPVSDFEEDSIHLKISRSALLSSLETKPTSDSPMDLCEDLKDTSDDKESDTVLNGVFEVDSPVPASNFKESCSDMNAKSDDGCDKNLLPISHPESQSLVNDAECIQSPKQCDSSLNSEQFSLNLQKDAKSELDYRQTVPSVHSEDSSAFSTVKPSVLEMAPKNNAATLHLDTTANDDQAGLLKPVVNKDQLANDIQAIIKKLLSYFTEDGSESFKKNLETDYISAWQLLETEIERLLQSIPSHTLDNNSCNSSTIDSNNSDYGSDTIESMDCMTDDDDTADTKIRLNSKCPQVDFLSSSYATDLSSFNISDETLSIWKRLIHSLQKDNALLSENKVCDPTAEARLYIKDQIVTLMHTVTVHDNLPEIEKATGIFPNHSKTIAESLTEDNYYPEEINEAYNVNLNSSNMLAHLPAEEVTTESKTESSSDEGISVGSTENVHSKTSASTGKQSDSVKSSESNVDSPHPPPDSFIEDSHDTLTEPSSNLKLDSSSVSPVPDTQQSPSMKGKVLELDQKYKKDSDVKFSVFVDIELGEDSTTVTERKLSVSCTESKGENGATETSSDDSLNCKTKSSLLNENRKSCDTLLASSKEFEDTRIHQDPGNSRSYRDTGYFSFKSSDDSLLNTSTPSAELVDVPNFKSLKRTVKKFQVSNTLSKSTNNILQNFSVPDTQFSTLQLKPKKSKEASNSSRQFTSLFSPSAMLKRFTGAKSNETPAPESSIPPKYLKKYARSISVDNESLFGAVSMPHLNSLKPGDSYSELGLYNERNPDSSLTLDDDTDVKRYFNGSQSVLSLGSHSASMTSVYSASGCHYGYVTVSGDVLFGLNYNQKSQMMEVFVKQCRSLAAIDLRHNKSNPYVKVYLLPDKTRSGKRKTKTKKNTLNPVFNELLRFPVAKNELESRTLWLSVWNSDLFGRNDFLGEISLPLGYRLLDSPTLRWYPLQERVESLTSSLNYKGELFIALKYVPRDLSLESRFRPAPVISQRGALHVLVKEARNITGNRSSGTLDAFCKSYLLPDKSKSSKQKTPVVKKSGHPKWYYTVIYEDLSMDELKEKSLELTVWDHDKLTSNEFMGGVRLNIGTGLYHGVPVDWMDSRRDESGLWQAMLESPNMWVDGCLPLRPTMQFHHS